MSGAHQRNRPEGARGARPAAFAQNALVVLISLALSLAAAEGLLRVLGWEPPEPVVPPGWFQALFADRETPPADAISPEEAAILQTVLPSLDTTVSFLPEMLVVTNPPGKPSPPDRADWTPPPFYVADMDTGWILAPGVEEWWMQEGLAFITSNKEGFRDVDHDAAKPPGVFRIAVLGDSFTEGLGIPFENLYSSVLQSELQRCPALAGRPVEVFNFGISGYGTTQELLTYRKYARKYHPDLVLLGFFPGNDLSDNFRDLAALGFSGLTLVRPFFSLRQGELVLDNSFRDELTREAGSEPWYAGFRLYAVARMPLQWYEKRNSGKLDFGAMQSPPRGRFADAWQLTERVLTQFAADVHGDGAGFVVATVSTTQQVRPDMAVRAATARADAIRDLAYPDKRLFRLANTAGFDMVPVASAMARIAEQSHMFFHGYPPVGQGEGHWNHNGHYVAGQILAKDLCGRIAAGPPP